MKDTFAGAVAMATKEGRAILSEAVDSNRTYNALRVLSEPGQPLAEAADSYVQQDIEGTTLVTFKPAQNKGAFAVRLCQGEKPGLVLVDDCGMQVMPNGLRASQIENAKPIISSGLLQEAQLVQLFSGPKKLNGPNMLAMGGSVWEWNGRGGIGSLLQAELKTRGANLTVGAINGDGIFQHLAKLKYLRSKHVNIDGVILEIHPTDVGLDMQRQTYGGETLAGMKRGILESSDKGSVPYYPGNTEFYDKEVFGRPDWFEQFKTPLYQLSELVGPDSLYLVGSALNNPDASGRYQTERWQPILELPWLQGKLKASVNLDLDPAFAPKPVETTESGFEMYPHPNRALSREMAKAVERGLFGGTSPIADPTPIMDTFYTTAARIARV